MNGSYYETLGVSEDATVEDIERAYRERLKESHPDVNEAADAADRTKRLIEAKEVLTDETERARYDRLGHERYVGSGDTGDGARAEHERHGTVPTRTGGTGDSADAATAGTTGADATAGRDDGETLGDRPYERRTTGREHVGDPGWSGHREATAGSSRAWNPDSPYAVHRSGDDGIHGSRRFPLGSSLSVLFATFVTYPVLVAAAVFPGFPLVTRLIVAGCALCVVAYLQSMPEVGLLVFGSWLVLAPAGLVALGVSLFSAVGAIALVATALPLLLSVLTTVALSR